MGKSNPSLKPMVPDDLDILTFCEQYWHLSGELPTLERAEELGLDRETYQKSLIKKEFQEALEERGIVLRLTKDFKAQTLTVDQLIVANTLLDLTDTRSQKKKLQDLGISTTKYEAWLKDPVFKEYMLKRSENVLGDKAHEVNLALMDAVRSGNIKAIEYYNEYTGRFVPYNRRPQEIKAGGPNGPAVDVHGIITSIIEIIQKRVTDAGVQAQIGNDIRALIERNATAHALTQSHSVQVQQVEPQEEGGEVLTDSGEAKEVTALPVGTSPFAGFDL